LGGIIGGLAGKITDLFKGADKPIRDLQTRDKNKDPYGSYPQWDTPQKRIKWLLDHFYYQSQYEKIQLHRKWFRNHLFFCLDGDTKIHLLDNRDVTLKQLSSEHLPVWSYGFDNRQGRIVPVQIERCLKTGIKPCVEVTLDNGDSFICTKDHRVLTWFAGYMEAGELQTGDRLVPLYRSGADATYGAIFQPFDARFESEHRWVATDVFGAYPKGKHVHHKDDNTRNNVPENLEVLTPKEHASKLSAHGRARISNHKRNFWKNPENRKNASQRTKQMFADNHLFVQRNREVRKTKEFNNARAEGIREWWSKPENREKQASAVAAYWDKRRKLKNHRVISVVDVGDREVYDVTVPRTSNIALSCGIFVHNCGYHDNILSDVGMSFDTIGVNQAEYSFASNYYRSYIRYGTAMYVQTAPEFIAQPNGPDPTSQGVAEAARTALNINKENIGYDAIRAMEAQNMRLYGNSFRYSYYSVDPRYGFVTAPVYEDVEVQLDQGTWQCPNCGMGGEGQEPVCPQCGPSSPVPVQHTAPRTATVPKLSGKTAYPRGQESCEVVWPFEVYVRSSIKNLWQAPYLLRVRMVDKVGLQATFPKANFAGDTMPGDTVNASEDIGLIYQQAIPELPSDPTQYPGWYERAVTQAKVPLIEGWIRPSMYQSDSDLRKKFPDGMYAAKADDCLLTTRNESMDDHWTHFKHIHVEGRFWGDGDDDLLPDQMLLDEVDRLILRHVDYNSLPLLLADAQRLDKNNIINDAGYVVELKNLGGKSIDQAAKWLPGGQLSTDVWNWRSTRMQNMQFNSGVSPSAIGQHEPGINTYGGQQQAAQASQSMLGPLQLMYREENEKWAQQMLKIDAENWLDDRVSAIMGPNGQWEFKQLRGEMLDKEKFKMRANIIPLDYQQQQSFNQAIAVGAFNPQLPPQVRRKALELYQLSPDLDEFSSDAKVQQKEIDQGKQSGQFPQPIAFVQNDQAHMKTLRDWMNSDDWDSQPPPVKVAAHTHFIQHMQNMATVSEVQGLMAQQSGQQQGQQSGNQQQSPQGNKNNNEQFKHDRGVKGQAAKPNLPQPSGGNQSHIGQRGQSHSAQQRRRNGQQ
jgi:hypothetical protein